MVTAALSLAAMALLVGAVQSQKQYLAPQYQQPVHAPYHTLYQQPAYRAPYQQTAHASFASELPDEASTGEEGWIIVVAVVWFLLMTCSCCYFWRAFAMRSFRPSTSGTPRPGSPIRPMISKTNKKIQKSRAVDFTTRGVSRNVPEDTGYKVADVDTEPVTPTGRTRALFIGINYPGSSCPLNGCHVDVQKMRSYLTDCGFDEGKMRVLVDDDSENYDFPTYDNILSAMRWLVEGASRGDCLFFHYSGHGAQEPDPSGTEKDGQNETLVPCDYEDSGMINDDMIWSTLVKPLPSGCRLTAVMDCCHSGTGMDLPFTLKLYGSQCRWSTEEDSPAMSEGDVQMFSGCKDNQTSADVGDQGGAMTSAFLATLEQNPNPTYPDFMKALWKSMDENGFSQIPQLSSSQMFDVDGHGYDDRRFSVRDGIVPNANTQVGRVGGRRYASHTYSLANNLGLADAGFQTMLVAALAAQGSRVYHQAADYEGQAADYAGQYAVQAYEVAADSGVYDQASGFAGNAASWLGNQFSSVGI